MSFGWKENAFLKPMLYLCFSRTCSDTNLFLIQCRAHLTVHNQMWFEKVKINISHSFIALESLASFCFFLFFSFLGWVCWHTAIHCSIHWQRIHILLCIIYIEILYISHSHISTSFWQLFLKKVRQKDSKENLKKWKTLFSAIYVTVIYHLTNTLRDRGVFFVSFPSACLVSFVFT